jgi:hypothetical protein
MAINERFTDLPQATPALTDIICAVQGYVSPTNLGTSVQETIGSILSLASNTLIQSSAGNPNGLLAGTPYNFSWDSVNDILYVCTSAGTSSTAVWNKVVQLTAGSGITISQAGSNIQISSTPLGLSFNTVSTATQAMTTNNIYFVNYGGGLSTLTLPAASSAGDVLYIMGSSASGWSIAQAAGQQITIGDAQTTVGVGGSLASTNRYDSLQLICTSANTLWQAPSGIQGILTIV